MDKSKEKGIFYYVFISIIIGLIFWFILVLIIDTGGKKRDTKETSKKKNKHNDINSHTPIQRLNDRRSNSHKI